MTLRLQLRRPIDLTLNLRGGVGPQPWSQDTGPLLPLAHLYEIRIGFAEAITAASGNESVIKKRVALPLGIERPLL